MRAKTKYYGACALQRRSSENDLTAPHTICAQSDPKTGGDYRVFRDDDDAVTDKIIVSVQVLRFSFRRNHDAISDARILVDDRTIDHTIFSNAHYGLRGTGNVQLKVIGTHDDAVADGRAALNDAAYADDASFQVRIGDNAAVGNNRLAQCCAVDFAAR